MSYCDQFFSHEPTRVGRWLTEASLRYAFRKLLEYGNIKSTIEIGPGRGLIANACRQRGIDYLGIDCNANACNLLQKQAFNIRQTLVPPYPTDIPAADAFIASMVIEHMPTCDKAVEFVQGARSLLNDDGLILLIAPDIRYSKTWFWHVGYSHNYVTSAYRLAQLLDEHGFEVLCADVRTQCFSFPWSHLLWYLSKLIPCQFLEFMFGKHPKYGRSITRKSVWFKAKAALTPSALVIARKIKG